MSRVQFCKCTDTEYENLTDGFKAGVLYFIIDTNKIMLDGNEISNNDASKLLDLGMLKEAVDERLEWKG